MGVSSDGDWKLLADHLSPMACNVQPSWIRLQGSRELEGQVDTLRFLLHSEGKLSCRGGHCNGVVTLPRGHVLGQGGFGCIVDVISMLCLMCFLYI